MTSELTELAFRSTRGGKSGYTNPIHAAKNQYLSYERRMREAKRERLKTKAGEILREASGAPERI